MQNVDIPTFQFALREDLKEEKQFLPTRAEPLASGWDVRCAFLDRKSLVLRAGAYTKIPLGFRAFCPDGWWYELKPRSSTFGKKHLNCLYGTVDQSFEGELVLSAQYLPDISFLTKDLTLEFGEAIGQIVPVRRKEMLVKEISNEEYDKLCMNRGATRGAGGFGSTDKR